MPSIVHRRGMDEHRLKGSVMPVQARRTEPRGRDFGESEG
jgi:hypothetical protein